VGEVSPERVNHRNGYQQRPFDTRVGRWAGFDRADPIVGIGISIAIFAVLRGAARQIYFRLMDAVHPEIVERVRHQAEHAPGVTSVHPPRVRWLGHRLVAELTIDVDPA